jgi:PP-loop superfamily ATP-utilizing enzyme
MFDVRNNILMTRVETGDAIACDLLKRIDRYEQFAIMHSVETSLLVRIFGTAIINEDYEICQVIRELLDEREMMKSLVQC